MSKRKNTVFKIKDDVELFRALPVYDYTFDSLVDGGAWTKIVQTTKGEYIGFNTVKINNKTKMIEYHGIPIFNNNLDEDIKELIDAGLVTPYVTSPVFKVNTINTVELISKIIDKSIGNKDYAFSGQYGVITIENLEKIVEEYK